MELTTSGIDIIINRKNKERCRLKLKRDCEKFARYIAKVKAKRNDVKEVKTDGL